MAYPQPVVIRVPVDNYQLATWVEDQEAHQQVPDKLSRLVSNSEEIETSIETETAVLAVAVAQVVISDAEYVIISSQHMRELISIALCLSESRIEKAHLHSKMLTLSTNESNQTVRRGKIPVHTEIFFQTKTTTAEESARCSVDGELPIDFEPTMAQKTQSALDSHHIAQHDPNYTDYPINSYVLYTPTGPNDKLELKHRGPYQVVNKLDSIYTIQDLVDDNLCEFHYDPNRTNPIDIAVQNRGEFLIDSVLEHRGDRQRCSTIEFKVRWRGYGPEHDSWEPYKNLAHTEQLILYLVRNRMRPKGHWSNFGQIGKE